MARSVYTMEMKSLFIKHRNNGKSLSWITQAMNISINTLKEWGSRLSKGGSLEDNRKGNGRKKKFSDEDLKQYLTENINATLKDIGDHFSVSEVAIWKRLKNMNFSYKKKRWHIEREMKNTEMHSK